MTLGDKQRVSRRPFGLGRLAAVALAGIAAAGGLVAELSAAPKPGMVTTTQGRTYTGEVDEGGGGVEIVGTDPGGKSGRFRIAAAAVKSIKYFANTREEYDARLANLAPADVAGRVALARWALGKNEPDLAAQAAAAARAAVAPNAQPPADLAAVEQQVAKARPPATGPATQPAPVAAVVSKGPAKRLLTADEIQVVRLREAQPNEKLRMQVPPQTVKNALAAGVIKPGDQRLPPGELGMMILTNGTPEMQREVKIQGDPVALADYRKKVNLAVVQGCAAANCHGGPHGGNLMLFGPADKEEAALTNFVALQKFEKAAGEQKVTRQMIDRTDPRKSLLLDYMLPPQLSNLPHPKVQGYAGSVRTATDPKFAFTMEWISHSLKPYAPPYDDIDLTTDAAKPGDAPKPGAAKPATGRAGG